MLNHKGVMFLFALYPYRQENEKGARLLQEEIRVFEGILHLYALVVRAWKWFRNFYQSAYSLKYGKGIMALV